MAGSKTIATISAGQTGFSFYDIFLIQRIIRAFGGTYHTIRTILLNLHPEWIDKFQVLNNRTNRTIRYAVDHFAFFG